MIETIVKVDGMMCGMCESHVNEAVRKAFPEVKRVSSSQAKAQTVIHSEQPLDEQKLRDAINATGFGPQALAVQPPAWASALNSCPPMWPACRWQST